MFQKLKFSKFVDNKKHFSKLIFLHKKIRKIQMIFNIENWVEGHFNPGLFNPKYQPPKPKGTLQPQTFQP